MGFGQVFLRTLENVGQATIEGLAQKGAPPSSGKRRKKHECTPCAAKARARSVFDGVRRP